MYHLVATRAEAGDARPSLVVAPRSFAAQMAALRARGWRTITAADLATDVREGVVPPARTFVITFDDGHEDGYSEAFPILRAEGFVATFFVITHRIGRPGYLTANQLAEMEAAGMEIGDHTVHHVALAAASPSTAAAEIAGAAATIASVVGSPPSTLAYPYGSHDPGAEAIVGRLGLAMAFTEVAGCRESYATRLAIPRIRVTPATTALDLVARMAACR
jgi:peptidoglycan/xylan/chitin deacetylase (PgdA/CDA1 family)